MPKQKYKIIYRDRPTYHPPKAGATGVGMVMDYLVGLVVFGFVWFILNDPISILWNNSLTVSNIEFAMFFWWGALVVYLVFGAFRFLSDLREWDTGDR